MLGRIGKRMRRLRRAVSRSEWAARYLRPREHDRSTPDPQTPGVVVIQIQGLGYDQLLQAIDGRKLPFLQRLVQRDNFVLRRLYSGLPSITPAVQAELFHGVKSAVPSFQYYDRDTRRMRTMADADTVDNIAHRVASTTGEALLAGGSSYANVFAGGAGLALHCTQSMNRQYFFDGMPPGRIAWLIILHPEKILRVVTHLFQGTVFSFFDFFRAIFRRKDPFQEFRFIISHAVACPALRELIRVHVKRDIARGLPIIHANFAGYDYYARGRNPDSALALATLKTMDRAIRDIVSTAIRSERRDYQILIYSDHGQEPVIPFSAENRETLRQAVTRVFSFGKLAGHAVAGTTPADAGPQLCRHSLSPPRTSSRHKARNRIEERNEPAATHITAMGTLGHIYLPCEIDDSDMLEYARQLVTAGGIPLVFFVRGKDVICVTATGAGAVADKSAEAFGRDHPCLEQVCQDIEVLCRHPDAGDFIISGHRPAQMSLSFTGENGAHGGPGTGETGAFVILPDIVSGVSQTSFRPHDLRHQITAILQTKAFSPLPAAGLRSKKPQSLTVMTYNIHSCVGIDGKLFPARTARIIGRSSPDLVALQEVDRNMPRTGSSDQPAIIAEQLGMHSCYFPVWRNGGGEYGLAILSRFPILDKRRLYLPGLGQDARTEKRGLLWATLQTPSGRLHLLNTHLSLIRRERLLQIRHITDTIIASTVPSWEPLILCGDFNAGIRSPAYAVLSTRLRDCQKVHAHIPPDPTFFSPFPLLRLDHIFHSDHLAPTSIGVIDDWECRLASDHLPLQATLNHEPGRL